VFLGGKKGGDADSFKWGDQREENGTHEPNVVGQRDKLQKNNVVTVGNKNASVEGEKRNAGSNQ